MTKRSGGEGGKWVGLLLVWCLLLWRDPVSAYDVTDATIDSSLQALESKEVTCVDFIQAHIDRINAYDKAGPALTSITNMNTDNALTKAAELDQFLEDTGTLAGRLHCMPIVAKDDYDHVDLPTTSASVVFADCFPSGTSPVITALEDEGAVMLAKTNLPDFTVGNSDIMSSTSTLIGATKNAYVSDRSPYGSSGGTGAAIAASMSIIGLAADTQGSIQLPAACEGMIGIRPTQYLTSGDRQFPLVIPQDSNGPISRTVEDAALILEIIVNQTVVENNNVNATYTEFLDPDGLRGKRIGFSRDVFDTVELLPGLWYTPDENVVRAADAALQAMSDAGAIVVDNVNIASALSDYLNQYSAETNACGTSWNRYGITEYLETCLLDTCPIKSIQDIIDSGVYPPGDDTREWLDAMVDYPLSPSEDPACTTYEDMKTGGEDLVLSMMADAGVDYILYPVFNQLPTLMEPEPNSPIIVPITYLSASTRMPSLTFPVAYADVDGVPISLSLTGPKYSEGELIALAYGYQQQVFSSEYHSTDLYPPLNGGDDDDKDDMIGVMIVLCSIFVVGGIFSYHNYVRQPPESDEKNNLV